MFQIKPETNSTRAFPFSFAMGPLTIYPLFLLPLIFWISPISSSTSTELAKSEIKQHKLHPQYTQSSTDPNEQDGVENPPNIPFYPNQPQNLQPPQKDRYYMSQTPMSYYQPHHYGYQNQFNYPSAYSSSQPSYYSYNPYYSSYPHQQNYQSHLYDPYIMMMQMSQPSKYGHSFQSSLLPQSSPISNMLSQSPHHVFQSAQPSNHPFYSNPHQHHSKPLNNNHMYEAQQMLQQLQSGSDPQSLISSYSPDSGHMLYSSSLSEPSSSSVQTSISQSQGQPSENQQLYQGSSLAASTVFQSLRPETQQLLSSLSPPFGFIDKQTRHPNEDPTEFIQKAPPKAIMVTTSDVLGLRAHQPITHPFNLNYTPDKHKQTLHKYTNKQGQSQYKRKPPLFQFNKFNNNKQFNFYPNDLDLKYTKSGKNVKATNGTTQPIFEQDVLPEEDRDQEPENPDKFISEPIHPLGSALSSSSWEMIDQVLEKEKKDSKPHPQPHNILPDPILEQEQEEKDPSDLQDDDPIPLFVIGDEDEDSRYFTQKDPLPEDSSFNSFKHQIYRCPSSRDLRELSEAEIYADPLKCDQFYYCKWGRAYVFKCPNMQYFNPYSNTCERDLDFACAMSLKK